MSKNLIKILHDNDKIVPFTTEDYIIHSSLNRKHIEIFNKNDDKTCTFAFKSDQEADDIFQYILTKLRDQEDLVINLEISTIGII